MSTGSRLRIAIDPSTDPDLFEVLTALPDRERSKFVTDLLRDGIKSRSASAQLAAALADIGIGIRNVRVEIDALQATIAGKRGHG